jgi:hypothetical protein
VNADSLGVAIDSEAQRIERETGRAALAHRMATSAWRWTYLALGVPTTALAALAGASALANYRVVAAALALLAAVASALMNFLNPAGQVAEHRKATGRYRAIENKARVFWEITCASDETTESLRHELAELVEEWNKAIDASPPLFERFHRRARLQYEDGARQWGNGSTELTSTSGSA